MAFVNHFYFYLWDPEWGEAFWKTTAYARFPAWLWLTGHEWAKRQLEKGRIGYTALGNGFRSCEDPALLQRLCDRLGPGAVTGLFWRWFHRLPSPFTTADVHAGYVYELVFRHLEISGTRVFDRPAAGRGFFEGVIRDHPGIGRPQQVTLIFGMKVIATTPGLFRTRVITNGVDLRIGCFDKSSRIKQYFKEHVGLRTETVICNSRDFGIGRRVTRDNWNALRQAGEHANQRLCDAQAADARRAPGVATRHQVTRPPVTNDGLRAPALRFGDPRVRALMAAIAGFRHLLAGSGNATLTSVMRSLTGPAYTSRQATYDLRRLKRKRLIQRLPGTHRYQVTATGRAIAVLFSKAYGRILGLGLTDLAPTLRPGPAKRCPFGPGVEEPHPRARPFHRPRAGRRLTAKLDPSGNMGKPKRGPRRRSPRRAARNGMADHIAGVAGQARVGPGGASQE